MGAVHEQHVPRGALIGAAGLIGISLLAVTLARLEKLSLPPEQPLSVAQIEAASVHTRVLQFVSNADGTLSIVDQASGRTIETQAADSGGFVRGLLRGIAREHKVRGVTGVPTARVTLWKDGRLTLDDVATGESIDLGAFGGGNRKTFEDLLLRAERGA